MKDLFTHNYIWEVMREHDIKPVHLPPFSHNQCKLSNLT